MIRRTCTLLSLALVLGFSSFASGVITITQPDTINTYSNTLNFDEPGTPTGIVSPDAFASLGITELQAGDGQPIVDDNAAVFGPWIGTGNSFFGNFGVFMKFDSDLTNFSANIWDPSGPPSPFGGGFGVFVFDDDVEVASLFGEPAWGGLGIPGVDVSASGGMVFDEVRILGFGFGPTTFADDLSWNVVPEPGCGLLIFLASLLMTALRRK